MTNRQLDYRALVSEMPPQMAGEVVTKLYGRFLAATPLFRGLSSEVITALCHVATPMLAVREQAIMEEGTSGREMFLLMKGEVEMLADGQRLGFLGEGAFFGERAVLSNESGAERRMRTVRAMSKCELCFLTKDAVDQLRGQYAELNARITRFTRAGTPMTGKQKQRLAAHIAAMNTATASAVARDATQEQQGQLLHVGKEEASDKLAGSISRWEANELRQSNAELKETISGMETKLDRILSTLQKSTLL
jgi:CRP-like cAMP-binding protein